MTINSRNKGAAGEREFAGLIHDHLGIRLVRNLEQTRSGGCDLSVHPEESGPVAMVLRGFAIEVKRCNRATHSKLMGFWEQAIRQAVETDRAPVLAYREDRQPWRVLVPLSLIHRDMTECQGLTFTAGLTVEGFASVIRERAA